LRASIGTVANLFGNLNKKFFKVVVDNRVIKSVMDIGVTV